MDNTTYRECWAHYLGGPSPMCKQWEGVSFTHSNGKKRAVIDKFGDNVATATLQGDSYRIRHDSFKWTVVELAEWCRFMIDTEPMHKFLPFIKQRNRFLGLRGRQRQGMVPDFLDIRRQCLMDVKTMSFGKAYAPARFRHAQRCNTVERRGKEVHRAITAKARLIDKTYNGWRPDSGTPGPVQQRLQGFGRVKGLVVGAHGEFSPDLVQLTRALAKQGAQSRHRDMGFDSAHDAYSTVSAQVWLALGIEATRGMARLRIHKLGIALAGNTSNKAAAARRQRSRASHAQRAQAYEARHCFYDI